MLAFISFLQHCEQQLLYSLVDQKVHSLSRPAKNEGTWTECTRIMKRFKLVIEVEGMS